MPIDKPELKGTEKDGTLSNEYCVYCYQHGAFTKPGMTLNEMKEVVKTQMQKRDIDPILIQLSLKNLPHLKRWKLKDLVM